MYNIWPRAPANEDFGCTAAHQTVRNSQQLTGNDLDELKQYHYGKCSPLHIVAITNGLLLKMEDKKLGEANIASREEKSKLVKARKEVEEGNEGPASKTGGKGGEGPALETGGSR